MISIKSYDKVFTIEDCYLVKINSEFAKEDEFCYAIVMVDKFGNKKIGMRFYSKDNNLHMTKDEMIKMLNNFYETYDIINSLTYLEVGAFYIGGEARLQAIKDYKFRLASNLEDKYKEWYSKEIEFLSKE